jgi:hypothetical protein
MKLAPIALFVYNRPEHARRTVTSLRENDLAKQSELFIFADGPKNGNGDASVDEVRRLLSTIDGFKSVTIVERELNLGLSESIISGVTELCNQEGRAIALEDDVMTAPDFLAFVNYALERYQQEPRVFSVTGHNFPIAAPVSYPYDAYFSYRSSSWGWATWKDRWEKTDWSVNDFPEFRSDRRRQQRFDLGGNDLTWMLTQRMAGRIRGTWDVVWAYTHSKHDAVALRAVASKVYNTGFDGSGTHCRRAPFQQIDLAAPGTSAYRFPEQTIIDPYFAAMVRQVNHRSLPKRLARYVFDQLGLEKLISHSSPSTYLSAR